MTLRQRLERIEQRTTSRRQHVRVGDVIDLDAAIARVRASDDGPAYDAAMLELARRFEGYAVDSHAGLLAAVYQDAATAELWSWAWGVVHCDPAAVIDSAVKFQGRRGLEADDANG